MLRSINKYKLYLYFFFFIFLSSTFNFQLFKNFKDKFSLKQINIEGVSDDEKKVIEVELNDLKNFNIFKLSEDKVIDKLNKFNFLENIYVKKIAPSSININLTRTHILGKTLLNGEEFYIGKNGKFINSNQISLKKKIPIVFGEFNINEFLNLYEILKNYQIKTLSIDKYFYFKNKRWDLVFSDGVILKLPTKNYEDSIKIYKKLLINNILKNIKVIDLRIKNQIILTKNNE